jgi:hypothetical protein
MIKRRIEVLGLLVLFVGIGLFLFCRNKEGNVKTKRQIQLAGVVNIDRGKVKCLLGTKGRLIKETSAIDLDIEFSQLPKIFHAVSLNPGSYIKHRNNPEDSKAIEVLFAWEDKGRITQIEILDLILNEEIKGFLTVENLFFAGSSLIFPACPPKHRLYLPGGKCGFCDLLEASEPAYKINTEVMPEEGTRVSIIFRKGVK